MNNRNSDKKNTSTAIVKSDKFFPVVGIGASAGGLKFIKELIQAIPENSGMAFVLIQHLTSEHKSYLPEILQKITKIPVSILSEDIHLEPNNIYLIPSDKLISAAEGKLKLDPIPDSGAPKKTIDYSFTSLAEIHHEFAIGIILSGSGSDGTIGLKSIKDNGGITIAQEPKTALFDSMPASAIDSEVVDFILSPQKIPNKLLEIGRILNSPAAADKSSALKNEGIFRQIISTVRVRKGTDFTYYKQSTIHRRILRRMAIKKLKKPAEYLQYIRQNNQELDVLYQDFLIPVTSFFRNPGLFNKLSEKIIPDLYDRTEDAETIRIWVAGCSTGEEAYSIAICFYEFLDNKSVNTKIKVQIFASDLSEPAIEKARRGIYSDQETAGVSKNRLNRFFSKRGGEYQVVQKIRDMCVFAHHNIVEDPPFGKLHLISCRNVLIYMDSHLQKKAFQSFHYALNPRGYLALGKSETAAGSADLFAPVPSIDNVYTRKDVPAKFMNVVSRQSEEKMSDDKKTVPQKKHSDFQKTADEILLNQYSPPGVVVNESMDIVQFRGKTGSFLEQAPGKPTHNLLRMAREGLSFELRNILHKVKKDNSKITKENVAVKINGNLKNISIEAIPLPDTIEPHYLIIFHENRVPGKKKLPKTGPGTKKPKPDEKETRIKQLEQELVATREDMRSITEEQEAANEELQTTNEELLSTSEELQSLNEELETSKEELQSTNEELVLVNQEMISLNQQIEEEKNYSESIVANLREPLLVLNENLRIRTANNAFYKLFKTKEKNTEGVLIYEHGDGQWDIPELRTLLEEIIPEQSVVNDYKVTHTFNKTGEMIMMLNGREVINKNNMDKLILLSIEDVTEQVREREKSRQLQEQHTRELKQKIDERTRELKNANDELLQKNEELVKMNKELEAFTYVSSHDLQEPLRKIQTFAGRILDKEVQNISEKGQLYFSFMQDAANRMQILINDLLSFSRLTTSEREFETADLNKIAEEVKDSFSETLEEKKGTIEIGKLGEADIIVFQFRQLLRNLISNSLKYSKPDVAPVIKIKGEIKKGSEFNTKKNNLPEGSILPGKKYCHISISDNGIGFEQKFNDKIFEVFQKLHNKEDYEGTGIGLATVKKIMDNHKGIITARSELDKGATFDIYFPCRQKN